MEGDASFEQAKTEDEHPEQPEPAADDGLEVLDGELVVQATAIEPLRAGPRALSWISPPVLQAAAAAATGFVAGAATFALLRRYGTRAARAADAWTAHVPTATPEESVHGLEHVTVGRSTTYLVQVRQILLPRE